MPTCRVTRRRWDFPDVQRTLNWVHLASRSPGARPNSRVQDFSEVFRLGESAIVIIRGGRLRQTIGMSAGQIRIPRAEGFTTWLPDFLKKELAPYPGRTGLVARTVISATLTMILIVTFRIPGGVVGALSAFVFSRENLLSTTSIAQSTCFSHSPSAPCSSPLGRAFLHRLPRRISYGWLAVCSWSFFCCALLRFTRSQRALRWSSPMSSASGICPAPRKMNVELTLWAGRRHVDRRARHPVRSRLSTTHSIAATI